MVFLRLSYDHWTRNNYDEIGALLISKAFNRVRIYSSSDINISGNLLKCLEMTCKPYLLRHSISKQAVG